MNIGLNKMCIALTSTSIGLCHLAEYFEIVDEFLLFKLLREFRIEYKKGTTNLDLWGKHR